MSDLSLNPELMLQVRWTSKGSCGQPGCPDPDCVCALCAKPLGISEEDPRRKSHEPDCYGCDLCEDDVQEGMKSFALVELYGHARIVGMVTVDPADFPGMVRVDVPDLLKDGKVVRPGFTRYFGE